VETANSVIAAVFVWTIFAVVLGCGLALLIVTTARLIRRRRPRSR